LYFVCSELSSKGFILILDIKSIVYKSHLTRSIVGYQIESEIMINRNCSIIETVYNMPELKSCPIETTFKIIGKRWTVLIIREILRGNTQFNRFMENIDGISPKVLTERLRELERLGIIRRRIISEYPVRVEYSLTDVGKGFEPVLLSAASFSMKYMPRTVFKDGKPRTPREINLTQFTNS
jgi:DNA-binding HxlR family transcriptional regulator